MKDEYPQHDAVEKRDAESLLFLYELTSKKQREREKDGVTGALEWTFPT